MFLSFSFYFYMQIEIQFFKWRVKETIWGVVDELSSLCFSSLVCWVRGGSFLRGESRGQAVGGLSRIRVWWLRWSREEVQCAVHNKMTMNLLSPKPTVRNMSKVLSAMNLVVFELGIVNFFFNLCFITHIC